MNSWDTWLSRVKTGLEILAIPAAGVWAFMRFGVSEAPLLEARTDVNGELSWHARTGRSCIGQYAATFHNIGTTPIDVTGGRIRAWLLRSSRDTAAITYLDPAEMREGDAIVDRDVSRWVKGHYSADVSRRINFAFRVRRNPGRIILFVTQGQAQSSGREDSWSSYEYGYVCGESEETRDSQAAKTPAAAR